MQEVRLRVNIIQYEIVIQIEIQRIFQNFLYELKLYKISLFLFLSKRESPYKTTSFLTLSDKDSILSETGFTLFIRPIQY